MYRVECWERFGNPVGGRRGSWVDWVVVGGILGGIRTDLPWVVDRCVERRVVGRMAMEVMIRPLR